MVQYSEYLQDFLALVNDSYKSSSLDEIKFTYIVKDGILPLDSSLMSPTIEDKPVQKYFNTKLPLSMDLSVYGKTVNNMNNISTIISEVGVYIIETKNNVNKVDLYKKDKVLYSWVDTRLDDASFTREIGKSTYYVVDGIIVLSTRELPAKPIASKEPSKKLRSRFMTLDIETTTKSVGGKNKHTPYLACAFDGKEYIVEYKDTDDANILSNLLKRLINIKYNNQIVYAHNLGGFDGIFIMRELFKLGGQVKPLVFNGKILSINYSTKISIINKKGDLVELDFSLTFKDSLNMLPSSLRMLCKAFGVIENKSYFPFKLSNIWYKNILPEIEYWIDIPTEEYKFLENKFLNKEWSFKDESIKYCKRDCSSLHEVLSSFNKLIFSNFEVNMTDCLTLPSLAFLIFKTHFIPRPIKDDKGNITNSDSLIYQILGDTEREIRESYTGGAVDMYKPHNLISIISGVFKRLCYYDVNFLFPTYFKEIFINILKIFTVFLESLRFAFCIYEIEIKILVLNLNCNNIVASISKLIFLKNLDKAICKFCFNKVLSSMNTL